MGWVDTDVHPLSILPRAILVVQAVAGDDHRNDLFKSLGLRFCALGGSDQGTTMLFEEGRWMTELEGTVARLGGELNRSSESFAFPVEFITSWLESKCCTTMTLFSSTSSLQQWCI